MPAKINPQRRNLCKIHGEDISMVNPNVQMHSRISSTKNKEHEMTQKQIRELREDLNNHQSETKDTIKREIRELKRTTQIIKEELNKDMENLRRKNQIEILEIKSLYKSHKKHSGRPLQQTRASGRQNLRT
jgi:gas vesicle protein